MSDIIGMGNPPAANLDDLKDAAPETLEAERRRIISAANGNYKEIPEEDLMRLAFITSTLRRKSSGPPKVARPTKASKTKATLGSMEDLL